MLDRAKIKYEVLEYDYDESDLSGVHAAAALSLDPKQVFKTLVTRGGKSGLFVFCIPVGAELDLKKSAKCAGVKSLEMIHVKELISLTGYMRGGCSPIGMKKQYPTFIDSTAADYEKIYVSAGQRGLSSASTRRSLPLLSKRIFAMSLPTDFINNRSFKKAPYCA